LCALLRRVGDPASRPPVGRPVRLAFDSYPARCDVRRIDMRHAIFAALFTLAAGSLFADDISGRVVSADGKPLTAAHIYVYQALPRTGPNTLCPSCYRDCGKHEALGADGAFTIRD